VHDNKPGLAPGFFLVRPAGRTLLKVKVLYTPGKGKCQLTSTKFQSVAVSWVLAVPPVVPPSSSHVARRWARQSALNWVRGMEHRSARVMWPPN